MLLYLIFFSRFILKYLYRLFSLLLTMLSSFPEFSSLLSFTHLYFLLLIFIHCSITYYLPLLSISLTSLPPDTLSSSSASIAIINAWGVHIVPLIIPSALNSSSFRLIYNSSFIILISSFLHNFSFVLYISINFLILSPRLYKSFLNLGFPYLRNNI